MSSNSDGDVGDQPPVHPIYRPARVLHIYHRGNRYKKHVFNSPFMVQISDDVWKKNFEIMLRYSATDDFKTFVILYQELLSHFRSLFDETLKCVKRDDRTRWIEQTISYLGDTYATLRFNYPKFIQQWDSSGGCGGSEVDSGILFPFFINFVQASDDSFKLDDHPQCPKTRTARYATIKLCFHIISQNLSQLLFISTSEESINKVTALTDTPNEKYTNHLFTSVTSSASTGLMFMVGARSPKGVQNSTDAGIENIVRSMSFYLAQIQRSENQEPSLDLTSQSINDETDQYNRADYIYPVNTSKLYRTLSWSAEFIMIGNHHDDGDDTLSQSIYKRVKKLNRTFFNLDGDSVDVETINPKLLETLNDYVECLLKLLKSDGTEQPDDPNSAKELHFVSLLAYCGIIHKKISKRASGSLDRVYFLDLMLKPELLPSIPHNIDQPDTAYDDWFYFISEQLKLPNNIIILSKNRQTNSTRQDPLRDINVYCSPLMKVDPTGEKVLEYLKGTKDDKPWKRIFSSVLNEGYDNLAKIFDDMPDSLKAELQMDKQQKDIIIMSSRLNMGGEDYQKGQGNFRLTKCSNPNNLTYKLLKVQDAVVPTVAETPIETAMTTTTTTTTATTITSTTNTTTTHDNLGAEATSAYSASPGDAEFESLDELMTNMSLQTKQIN